MVAALVTVELDWVHERIAADSLTARPVLAALLPGVP